MKDNAIKWLTELNPFDKVKGHTKIELTDVKTGKKQIIEKDNAFQAGVLASYMRSMGAYNNNPYANGTWAGQPIWRNLCGGIFCFRDAIDLTGGEVEYMPAGNEMVANGAYMVNNAGTPIELGSYNEVESSTSGNDSVTFVYDWMTHQGNGTISCICLTTEVGGYIGYGNPSGGAHDTLKSFVENQNSNSLSGIVYNNYRWGFEVDLANNKITVTKTPTEVSNGSIFDNIAEDTFDVSFSGSVTATYKVANVYLGNGKVALIFLAPSGSNTVVNTNISNGDSYKYLVYDMATNTATVESIANNTGDTLWIGYTVRSEIYLNLTMNGNYALIPSTSGKLYAIKKSDGTYVDTGISIAYSFGGGIQGSLLTDELLYIKHRTNSGVYIFDSENQSTLLTNGSNAIYDYNSNIDALTDGSHVYKNPLILATINNLETPVTKTAAQTMKITYTLTKATE